MCLSDSDEYMPPMKELSGHKKKSIINTQTEKWEEMDKLRLREAEKEFDRKTETGKKSRENTDWNTQPKVKETARN